MKKNVRALVALGCALVAAVALAVMFLGTSDEDRIRKVLAELTKTVAAKEGDTLISRAARVKGKLGDLVDDDVRVHVEELSVDVRGREKLETEAIRAGLLYQKADCDLSSLSIKIDPQRTTATVDAVAVVSASGGERESLRVGGGRVDKRDVHFLLRRDTDWKIATIDVAPRAEDTERQR